MHLDEAVLQQSDSSIEEIFRSLTRILTVSFTAEQTEEFINKNNSIIVDFFQSVTHTSLYIFINQLEGLNCSLQFNFSPSFAHACVTKVFMNKPAFLAIWIPAESTIESVFKAYNGGISQYLQSYCQHDA